MAETFYETQDVFRQRFSTVGRLLGFRAETEEQWGIWHQALRAKIAQLTGYDRLVPTDPRPRITETVQRDGYRRERVLIDTEPGVTMSLYVLVPDNLAGTAPAVLAPHGHGSGGKYSPAGAVEIPGIAERVKQYNYDYGVKAAQKGYVVFCPDARGFGERRESLYQGPEALFESSCRQLAHMGLPLGLTVAGMWAWDLSRLIDYAFSRPETTGQKLGCIGLSGGGLQTLYLCCLDDRVDCAVISGYFYGVADSLLHLSGNCDCNYVPDLWSYADMGDMGALIAPTPLLIESGRQDPLNGPRGIDNVLEQYEITKRAYELLNAEDRLAIDIFEGEHMWHGVAAMDWLDRWLR